MGLFTYVNIPKDLLPERYKDYEGWQTKDVVDPEMETLEITSEGELYYLQNEYEWVHDENDQMSILLKLSPEHRGYSRSIKLNRIKQEFHGDMLFYTWDETLKKGIDIVARFSYGKLDYTKTVHEE